MARVVDLTGENLTRQRRKERNYGTKTDLSSTSVERGNTHWAEGSNVNIDGFLGVAGTQRVTGLLDVTGTFNGSGTNNLDGTNNLSGDNNLTGPTEISGSLDVTGPTNLDGVLTINGDTTITGMLAVDGPTTISGTLDIEGATTVAADLELIAGGLLKAGVTKIEPTGKATFGTVIIDPASTRMIQSPSGWLTANGADSVGLSSSNTSSVNLNGTYADLNYAGTSRVVARAGAIDLAATTVNVSGALKVAGRTDLDGSIYLNAALIQITPSTPTIASPPNLFMSASGRLYRSTWTPPA
ncbi:hypothetical protein [Glutamicibacter mysorens]|uniref:hypothetical protein n=1 Tax=Glutamicibacter mysorens TaxID=257984 RepID=UPI0020C7131E|nr:hypothetical protein [Glutamicibacter mysorens]UTM47046.1 hypothetical protein XH9_16150 [Glutamicibacter mysorens]